MGKRAPRDRRQCAMSSGSLVDHAPREGSKAGWWWEGWQRCRCSRTRAPAGQGNPQSRQGPGRVFRSTPRQASLAPNTPLAPCHRRHVVCLADSNGLSFRSIAPSCLILRDLPRCGLLLHCATRRSTPHLDMKIKRRNATELGDGSLHCLSMASVGEYICLHFELARRTV